MKNVFLVFSKSRQPGDRGFVNKELSSRMKFPMAIFEAILWVLLISFLTYTAGCKNGNKSGADPTPEVKQFQTNTEYFWNGGTITGKVKNLNDAKISFVSVEFDLVDERHRVLRTVSAVSENGIEPNGEWEFTIEAAAVGARSVRTRNTTVR